VACPANFDCGGKNESTIRPQVGYFASNGKTKAYRCPNADACLENGCKAGYAGPLCAECAPGLTRDKNFECAPCPPNDELAGIFIGGVCLAALAVGVLFYTNKKSATKEAANHSVMLKIFLGSLQFNSLLLLVDYKWPSELQGFLSVSGYVGSSSEALNFKCMFPDYDTFFLASLMFALLPTLVVLLIWLVFLPFLKCKKLRREHLILACCIGVVLIFTSVVVNTMALFVCKEVEDKLYVLGDMSVECWSAKHNQWVVGIAVPSILFNMVLLPLAAVKVLKRNAAKIAARDEATLIKFAYLTKGASVTRAPT
jgi:hypothetical protein